MNETPEVVIVGTSVGITIRGIESKLEEHGIPYEFVGVDSTKLIDARMRAGAIVVCVHDDAAAMTHLLGYIGETSSEAGLPLVVLADKKEQMELGRISPPFVGAVTKWLERGVDMENFVNVVDRLMKEGVPKKAAPAKKSVLIVDDDPTYAKMVREWLKEYYQISVVTGAMQAISFLTKKKVDLVLLDYEMPVVSGPQVLELMRNEPDTAGIPVVFLTGVGDAESVSRVIALKPAGYILKSASREDILSWLRKYFNK